LTDKNADDAGGFDYESLEVGYYDSVFHRHQGVQSKWHHLKFLYLQDLVPENCRHLDVGCGPGTFIGNLEGERESVGVDIAANQIDYANKRYGNENRTFQEVDGGPLPFPQSSFDVVTCIELIEHLDQDAAFFLLRHIKGVLSGDGEVLITTPDYGGAWPALEACVNALGPVSYKNQHINKYTRDRLQSDLMEAGFQSVSVERYLFMAPFGAAISWRMADWIDRLEPRWLTRMCGFLLVATAKP
jgi:2-polyprenyl-3-methyl-5-hydroxy-6-metoxy-1,4-benzoquinol methylase